MKPIILGCVIVLVAGCGKKPADKKDEDKKTPAAESGPTRSTEAALQLNKIAKNAKMAYAMNAAFPKGKAATLPESTGPACCGGDGGKCKVSTAWANDPVWASLDFMIDEPGLFRYSYESDGQTFTATAVGDLDCDGTTITYKLTGTAQNGNAATTLEPPPPNSD